MFRIKFHRSEMQNFTINLITQTLFVTEQSGQSLFHWGQSTKAFFCVGWDKLIFKTEEVLKNKVSSVSNLHNTSNFMHKLISNMFKKP